jgi:hypothetical protein
MKRYMSPWTRDSWKRFFVGRPLRKGCFSTVTPAVVSFSNRSYSRSASVLRIVYMVAAMAV